TPRDNRKPPAKRLRRSVSDLPDRARATRPRAAPTSASGGAGLRPPSPGQNTSKASSAARPQAKPRQAAREDMPGRKSQARESRKGAATSSGAGQPAGRFSDHSSTSSRASSSTTAATTRIAASAG